MQTENAKTLELLEKELAELKTVLDKVQPNWLNATLQECANENKTVKDSVCLPIKAAINIIKLKIE